MPKKVNIAGLKFNRLFVLNENGKTNDGKIKWLCLCDCGNEVSISGSELRSGGTKSCGCLASEMTIKRNTTHGLSSLPEYKIWKGIKARCFNPKSTYYIHYGGRGITMHPSWVNSFDCFIADVGKRPSKIYSIERKINSGNYEPGNCFWATKKEQSANKRNNRTLTFNGNSMILQQWADKFKIPVSTLHSQLKVNSFDSICIKNGL